MFFGQRQPEIYGNQHIWIQNNGFFAHQGFEALHFQSDSESPELIQRLYQKDLDGIINPAFTHTSIVGVMLLTIQMSS